MIPIKHPDQESINGESNDVRKNNNIRHYIKGR